MATESSRLLGSLELRPYRVCQPASRPGSSALARGIEALRASDMLMLTGLAFTMVGFALDSMFNPRLREM